MPLTPDASDPGGWTAAATTGPTTGGATPHAMPLPPDDRFRDALAAALAPTLAVERELEGGGMARVFVAREVALGRRVVVKVLPPDLAAGVNRERFRREIQLAAALQHPHIVPLLAAGELQVPTGAAGEGALLGGSLYYTMPFIEGESLRAEAAARSARGQAFTPREVLRLLREVVGALGHAHVRGVVHRDVKPGNVLLQSGHALVTDFGVAKALAASLPMAAHTVTTLGMAVGTPAYMAPEQLAADPAADHRVDLYAAGLVAYELLTGASPFAAASPQATLAAQLTRVPDPLGTVRPDVPPAFADVVMRCLAKDPAARPATAAELLDALEAADGVGTGTYATFAAAGAAPTAARRTEATTAAAVADAPTTAGVAAAHAYALPPAAAPTVAAAPRAMHRSGRRALVALGAGAVVALGGWLAVGGARGRPASGGEWTARADAAAPAAAVAAAAAPGAAARATPAPALSRADSVAIARAVAREFERAMTQGTGTTAAAAAGTAPARPPARVDTARQRRAARDVIVDSLTKAGAWQHMPKEVVRAVVGRVPLELTRVLPPDERRDVEEAIREAKHQLRAAGALRDMGTMAREGPTPPAPPPAPNPPGGAGGSGEMTWMVPSTPWPGFTALTAKLPPVAPGARRAVLVGTLDETGRPELATLGDLLDASLRKRLRASGPYEVTNPAISAVTRHERVPDVIVLRGTGADAVLRAKLRRTGDDEVRAVLHIRDARGAPTIIEARVPLAKGATLFALADSLAAPLARGAAAALAGRDPRAGTP